MIFGRLLYYCDSKPKLGVLNVFVVQDVIFHDMDIGRFPV